MLEITKKESKVPGFKAFGLPLPTVKVSCLRLSVTKMRIPCEKQKTIEVIFLFQSILPIPSIYPSYASVAEN